MKTFASLLIACFASIALSAQNPTTSPTQVPDNVSSKFSTQYPTATPTWKLDGNNYSAWYTDPQTKMQSMVVYDKDGNLVRRENELDAMNYPSTINDYYTKTYPTEKDYKVWSSEDATGNRTYYTKRKGQMIWFDKDGNYVPGRKK